MHKWSFFRVSGVNQVRLRNGADIGALHELDQKLWTALSAPITGVRMERHFLELLDSNQDGRIRVPEVLAAIEWLKPRLTSLDPLLDGKETLDLSTFDQETEEGRVLLANAQRLLANIGKEGAGSIALADTAEAARIFADLRFNGDGVVPEDAADDVGVRQVIGEIIATVGSVQDRSGKPGVDEATVERFFNAIESHLAWLKAADDKVLPLGDATGAAMDALIAVRDKVEDFFTRCRLASFNEDATKVLNPGDSEFRSLADSMLTEGVEAVAALPLSRVEAGAELSLSEALNPAWQMAIEQFRECVVAPLLGETRERLSLDEWRTLQEKLAPYNQWQDSKAGTEVAGLGVARLEEITAGGTREAIGELIAQDVAKAGKYEEISEVERLLFYKTNLNTLLLNFVNMSRLYDPDASAIFQVGTLYMDARASSLCFHVQDVEAHAAQAESGKICLAYCKLTRADVAEPRHICAAVTAGFARTLWVGRNGIFYDTEGRDWDAVIVKMIDHSISLKEAFWEPWRKVAEMVSAQVKKMLAGRQDAMLASAATKVESAASAPPAEPPKKMEGAALASSVAALGIAVGLIGSAVGALVSAIAGLPLWKLALGVVAVVLLVSGPAMILTWFKLRARDVAPILNACGWAVNRHLRISLKLGSLFTTEAALPEKSELQLSDPFADDHRARNRIVLLLLLTALAITLFKMGLLSAIPHL